MGTQTKVALFFLSFFISYPAWSEDPQDLALNLGAGLKLIRTYHLDPPSLDQLTLRGLSALERVDPKITLARQLGFIDVIYDYQSKKKFPTPTDDRPESWAVLLANIIRTLQPLTPDLQKATNKQWIDLFFGVIVPTLDPYSRYFPLPQEGGVSQQSAQQVTAAPQPTRPFQLDIKDQQANLIISIFYPTLAQDVLKAIPNPEDLKAMTIDLENTTGGSFEGGIAFCNLFIDKGIIIQTKGRHLQSNHHYRATPPAPLKHIDLTLRIGKETYSTGEMVALSLQENKHANLVGEPTFGKDAVQRLFPLPSGGQLSLTWANFYSSKNQHLNGKGVTPSPSA